MILFQRTRDPGAHRIFKLLLFLIPAIAVAFVLVAAPVHSEENGNPFEAGWIRVSVARSTGEPFDALLYYPAESAGYQTVYDGRLAPYPAIVFAHGYLQSPSGYSTILGHLAANGYFVIAPESALESFPSHSAFALDLQDALTWLEERHHGSATFLAGQVDTGRFGMSGHSMGGGVSILATSADGRVKALANLAAAETDPSAIAAISEIRVPICLIAGSQDKIVPVALHTRPMYDEASPPRLLQVIRGGWHCGFIDYPSLFSDAGTLPLTVQRGVTCRLLSDFFDLYLKGDESRWQEVWSIPTLADPLVRTTADPGMTLYPPFQRGQAAPGDTLVFDLVLQNTGQEQCTYDIFADSLHWPTASLLSSTPPVEPGEEVFFSVEVSVPPETDRNWDVTVVSARSGFDGLTRGIAVLQTSRTWR